MFETLDNAPADPLLKLISDYTRDARNNKIDLGVGVYRDEAGQTPVLAAVKAAEERLLRNETSKAYLGPAGNADYAQLMTELVLGDQHSQIKHRLAHIQTPGGCGALRLLAELAMCTQSHTLWVSDPTWANHIPLMGSAGLEIHSYPYYNFDTNGLRFSAMYEALSKAERGDIVLVHACCHNPSGADLSEAQWRDIVDLFEQRGLVPLIDVAYQGFGESLHADVYGVRLAVSRLPEVMIAVSCSKSFGLYRERVGSAMVITESEASALAASSQLAAIARSIYSMPPSHGAAVVAEILRSEDLREQWWKELDSMRARIQSTRVALCDALREELADDRFDFIASERGMFSFLGISEYQVTELAKRFAIYMAGSGRINIAGLNQNSLPFFVQGLAQVIK